MTYNILKAAAIIITMGIWWLLAIVIMAGF